MSPLTIRHEPASLYTGNRGVADIRVVQSTTTSAGAAVWALRCATAGKVLYVTKIWMQFSFKGTGAATEMQYEWVKGTGCTGMTGGAAVTPLLKKTSITNADVDCSLLDTGLTQTAISQGTPFWNGYWSRLTHSATQGGVIANPFLIDFADVPLELAKNEVLTLRQVVTSVANDCVSGGVEFYG